MKDEKLWKIFSEWIRLRDSDRNGICRCFTCGFTAHYKKFDAGHGIGRQHKSTKFDERNVHAQCGRCNRFEQGNQAIYKEEVEKRYGEGTWQKLYIKSKQVCKRGQAEIDVMTAYYKKEVEKLKKEKCL